MAPKDDTANFVFFQMKSLLSIRHFSSSSCLLLYSPVLSQEKHLQHWRGMRIKQLGLLPCLWTQNWMIINFWVFIDDFKSHHPKISGFSTVSVDSFNPIRGHKGWERQSSQYNGLDTSHCRRSVEKTEKSKPPNSYW